MFLQKLLTSSVISCISIVLIYIIDRFVNKKQRKIKELIQIASTVFLSSCITLIMLNETTDIQVEDILTGVPNF